MNNIISQLAIVIMLSVMLGVVIAIVGFFSLQHQKIVEQIAQLINGTEQDNIRDRAHSDALTRIVIYNVTGEATNSTKAILNNITSQIDRQTQNQKIIIGLLGAPK